MAVDLEKARERYMAILESKKADGARRFTNEEIENYLPLFMLKHGVASDPTRMTADEKAILDGFVVRAKIGAKATPEEALAALEGWYAKNPVNAELDRLLASWAQETFGATTVSAVAAGAALSAFVRGERPAHVLGGGARPEGTVPGGVLGRLATTKKT